MPARFERCTDGKVRFVHTCEVCGSSIAPFGKNCNLIAAMAQKNAALAGKWYCAEHWKIVQSKEPKRK